MTTLNQVSIFISYAHEDKKWVIKLKKHLGLLKRQGVISIWYDREIVPGTNRAEVVDQHLEQASLILLLVSADFLASDDCYNIEMRRALKRHEAGEARVIPLIIRPTDWSTAPFACLSPLPTHGKAITTWNNRDEAFVDIVTGLRQAIEDLSLLSAHSSQSALPDIWNIPYPHNAFFMGRDDLLKRLHAQLQTGQATALSQSPHAISGLGGIGKTQLATEYAYHYHQDYEAVLWARAENQDALNSSYITIAMLLKLPERDAGEPEIIIEAVKAWLQTHQKWLLILDNADNLDILPPFLPPAPGGHILITTREWAMQGFATRLEVKTLSDEQGAVLLLRRAGLLAPDIEFSQVSPEYCLWSTKLTRELGGLPLALDQAGAYLEENPMSLEKYYQMYQDHRQMLLQKSYSRILDHPEPVATTWLLSFQQVKEKNPAAASLLHVCAYLSPDAIPEEIITKGALHLGKQLARISTKPFLLSEAIGVLRAYSLLSYDPGTQTLSIHRLVQAVLRDNMDKRTTRRYIERAIKALVATLPEVRREDLSPWERFIGHVQICAELVKQYKFYFTEAGLLLYQMSEYLVARGRYQEALPWLKQVLSISEQEQGKNPLDVARYAVFIGWVCVELGRYIEAEQYCLRSLAIREEHLEKEHLDIAETLNILGIMYKKQGRYVEAESFYLRVLAIREQELGKEDPWTAQILNNLAALYFEQGKYAEAETLYQRALIIYRKQSGEEDLETANTSNNLATLYRWQGKYAQAEPYYQQAVTIFERLLGRKHPQTAVILNQLAALYENQERYAEAEQFYLESLTIDEELLGKDHPEVATDLANLATFYTNRGRYAEAESLYKRALAIRELSGAEHPYTAVTLDRMASLYEKQGKYAEAEPLYLRALTISKKQLEKGHPQITRIQRNYAFLLRTVGRDDEASKLESEGL